MQDCLKWFVEKEIWWKESEEHLRILCANEGQSPNPRKKKKSKKSEILTQRRKKKLRQKIESISNFNSTNECTSEKTIEWYKIVNMEIYSILSAPSHVAIGRGCWLVVFCVEWNIRESGRNWRSESTAKHETYPRCHRSVTPVQLMSSRTWQRVSRPGLSFMYVSSFIRGIIVVVPNDNYYEIVIPVHSLWTRSHSMRRELQWIKFRRGESRTRTLSEAIEYFNMFWQFRDSPTFLLIAMFSVCHTKCRSEVALCW